MQAWSNIHIALHTSTCSREQERCLSTATVAYTLQVKTTGRHTTSSGRLSHDKELMPELHAAIRWTCDK